MRINLADPIEFTKCFEAVTGVGLDSHVSGISTDSREVENGDLYIALEGLRTNGHNYISSAASVGCTSALVSRSQEKMSSMQQIVVESPLLVIGEIANYWRRKINIPVIGITGTNGKTSTKELIKHVMSVGKKIHSTFENYNTSFGVPLTLLTMSSTDDISVMEFGANQIGDINYLCKIAEPNHGLITNIAPAHLEGFGSLEDIKQEKGELLLALKDGFAFKNKADQNIRELPSEGREISYGLSSDCDFPTDIISESNGNLTLIIDSVEVPTNSKNLSYVKNVIAAASVSITLGLEWDKFRERILTYNPPKGRCEIKKFELVTVIDDTYNANLESTIGALNYLKAYGGTGKNIFIFGDMFELGEDSELHHRQIGQKCKESEIDAVYLVGEKTKFTDLEINSSIYHQHFSSKDQLAKEIKDSFSHGDVILIKGSRGMAMETIIQDLFE